jgi:hypothetical protein
VKPKADDGNLFSIQSSTNHGNFLGVDSTQLVKYGSVRGLPFEFFWELQSVGGFGYTYDPFSVRNAFSDCFPCVSGSTSSQCKGHCLQDSVPPSDSTPWVTVR